MKTTAFTFSLAWSENIFDDFSRFFYLKRERREESRALDAADRLYNTQQLKELKIRSILRLLTKSESSPEIFFVRFVENGKKEKSF